MKHTVTITPKVDLANHLIVLEEVRERPSLFDARETATQFAKTVVNLRDKAVRDALICLGWRPPAEPDAQHSSTTIDHEARLRVRSHDPGASMVAAERAAAFARSHAKRILYVCTFTRPLSTAEIAAKAGLTVVQVARRTVELQREGKLIVAQLGGEDMVVGGYRCWLLAPVGGAQ